MPCPGAVLAVAGALYVQTPEPYPGTLAQHKTEMVESQPVRPRERRGAMSSGNGTTKSPELPKLLGTDDLAELMGVSTGAIRNRRTRGASMPTGYLVGRDWVYCRRDVEEWMRGQTAKSP